MCGRFTLTKTKTEIADYLASLSISVNLEHIDDFIPQYNIAPTQNVLAIVSINNQWQCQSLRWGLIPSWFKQQNINGKPLINARRETISQKASFKNAFAHRRCLILADGFYEWNHHLYGKNPLYFHLKNNTLFAFAGLWESYQNPQNKEIINSTTIINTFAEGVMEKFHPRMPVVLNSLSYQVWLNSQAFSDSDFDILMQEYNIHDFFYYPVSKNVNLVTNNYPNLLREEKVIVTEQLSLF
jgi:putative SOS response-associated peptidase YedK